MSTPTLQEFNPNLVKWQMLAIKFYLNFNFALGILELMFSGSIGSAKSLCAAHLISLHAIRNPGSRQLIVRRALKDLKRTLWQTLLTHLSDSPQLIRDYNKTEMRITLINGSEIIGDSYDKGDLEKFRSLELSGGIIEEASESNKEVYEAIKMRIGRLPNVRENYFLTLTNPDEPSHYLYESIIEQDGTNNKKVFYSLTEQNKFLPPWYIQNLKKDLDPLMARRMLKGEWLSIQGQTPYHAYQSDKQFLKDREYVPNYNYPIDIFHDWNIGQGKPMSAGYGQIIDGIFHIGKTWVVEGFDTNEIIAEMIDSGLFNNANVVRIFGDRNGKDKDTRGNKSDYDIVLKALQNFRKPNGGALKVIMQVPNQNPPVRARQNIVNAHCLNDNGDIRLFVYKDAKILDKGLRLTKVKKGSNYQEDDNNDYQHIVSGLGYYIHYYKNSTEKIGTLKPYMRKR